MNLVLYDILYRFGIIQALKVINCLPSLRGRMAFQVMTLSLAPVPRFLQMKQLMCLRVWHMIVSFIVSGLQDHKSPPQTATLIRGARGIGILVGINF